MLKTEVRNVDGITVMVCEGRIDFGEPSSALRESLKRLLATSKRIVLNLAKVTHMDSGGLGTLVGVYSSAKAAGCDIKLAELGKRLHDTLQVTKLVSVFEVYDSERQAVASFQHTDVAAGNSGTPSV